MNTATGFQKFFASSSFSKHKQLHSVVICTGEKRLWIGITNLKINFVFFDGRSFGQCCSSCLTKLIRNLAEFVYDYREHLEKQTSFQPVKRLY